MSNKHVISLCTYQFALNKYLFWCGSETRTNNSGIIYMIDVSIEIRFLKKKKRL